MITRDKEHLKWNIKDFVDALQAEVELRECHALTSPAGNNNDGNNYSRRLVRLELFRLEEWIVRLLSRKP